MKRFVQPGCWLALVVAALLQACGGGSADSAPRPQPTSEVPGGPVQAPTPTPPAPGPAPTPAPTPTPPPTTANPAVTPVGEVLGPVVAEAQIGPAGGRLVWAADGLTIIVPPGALTQTRTIALRPISNTAPGAVGNAWRITPEGVTFALPVTLEWRATAAERQGAASLRIASQGADGVWRTQRAGTDSDGVLRTRTTHFSDWSKVAGVQLRPGAADVPVNGSLQLVISSCSQRADPNDPLLVDLVLTCEQEQLAGTGDDAWAVNDVVGGNASLGTIAGRIDAQLNASGMYQAPASVPGTNPVAVSVRYRDALSPNTVPVTLVANLNIIDPGAGCRWLQGVNSLAAGMSVSYAWSGGNESFEQSNAVQINVRGRLTRAPLSPIGQVWFEGTMDDGTIAADYLSTSKIVGSTMQVTASGTPSPLAHHKAAHVFVDLSNCRMIFTAHATRAGLLISKSKDGTDQAAVMAGGGIHIANWPLEGKRSFGEQTTLDARQNNPDATTLSYFRPEGMAENFDGVIGRANVRWSLVPQ